jgi:SPP1 family predicted phage head-tail adaptor
MANPPTLAAGILRHRVDVQRATQDRDDLGGVVQTWTRLVRRWAAITPLQGRELEAARQIEARITHRITMRAVAGLGAGDRLLFGTRVFHILAPLDMEEYGLQLRYLCMEVLP